MELINLISRFLGIPAPFVWMAAGAFVMIVLRRAFHQSSELYGRENSAGMSSKDKPLSVRSSIRSRREQVFHFQIDGKEIHLSDDEAAEFFRLLKKGDKINAIKILRTAGEIGLADAKNLAEALEQSLDQLPDMSAPTER